MELTNEKKSILYIALSNSSNMYFSLLEETKSEEEKVLINHLLLQHEDLMDEIARDLGEETPISKPSW